jgi:hypothetical protein
MYKSFILAIISLLCSDIVFASDGEGSDSPLRLRTPLLNRTSDLYSPRLLDEPCSTIKNMTKSQVITLAAKGTLHENQEDLNWFLQVTRNPSLVKTQDDVDRWTQLKHKVINFQFPNSIELTEVAARKYTNLQHACSTGLETIFTSVFMDLVSARQHNDPNQEEERKQFFKGFYGSKDDSE